MLLPLLAATSSAAPASSVAPTAAAATSSAAPVSSVAPDAEAGEEKELVSDDDAGVQEYWALCNMCFKFRKLANWPTNPADEEFYCMGSMQHVLKDQEADQPFPRR